MDMVKAIHCTSDNTSFFLCDNEYYTHYTLKLNNKVTNTSAGFSEAKFYSDFSRLA